jgi:hypothetical protein
MHIEKNLDVYYSWHETLPQTHTQLCNKNYIDMSLMWAD